LRNIRKNKMVDILKEIEKNQVTIFTIPNIEYAERLKEMTWLIGRLKKAVCFVALNKSYKSIIKDCALGENADNFLFIDAVSKPGREVKQDKKVIFLKPEALTELNMTLGKALKTGKFDYLIFDSLSSLLVYKNLKIISEFTRNLTDKIKSTKTKGVFTVLEDNINPKLIENLSRHANKVISLARKEKEKDLIKTQ